MPGPWEAYQSVPSATPAPTAGPWQQYSAAPAPVAPQPPASPAPGASAPVTVGGVTQAAGSGLVGSIMSLAGQVNPFSTTHMADMADSAATMGLRARQMLGLNTKAQTDNTIAAFERARQSIPLGLGRTTQEQQQDVGLYHAPQNEAEQVANVAGSMLPNAFMGPEGLLPRIASVALPTAGSEGARLATRAAGGGPTAQMLASVAGGMVGGGFSPRGPRPIPQILTAEERPAARAIQAALDVTGAHRDDVKAAMSTGVLPVAATPGLAQLGETVATLPGAGKATLQDAVGARMATQGDRAIDAVNQHLGVDPTTARGNVDGIVAAGRQAAGPIYDNLRADPAPVWNADLANLAQRPAIKKAIGVVSNNMLNSGQHPTTAGFAVDPDTGWHLPETLDNAEQQPTAATWIGVHQALGQTVERNPITGRPLSSTVSPGNHDIAVAGGDLRNALTNAIPGYDRALATSGDYLSTSNAFGRAQGTLFTGPVHDFQQMWSSLGSPSEQQAARAAMANDILERADRGTFLPGQFKSPGVQRKLQIAFGSDGARQFTNQMEADLAERGTYNNILSNSRTAGRQALVANYAANAPKPSGLRGAAANAVSAAKWGQAALTAPHMIPTMLAEKVIRGGKAAEKTPPWEDPATNAALGNLLSDHDQMREFLDRMAAQGTADYQGAQARKMIGLATLPRAALPGLIGVLAAPSTGAAGP